MVMQKRLDYGFNGYEVPSVPRASRSPRGRGKIRKKPDSNQIQAFDILASVAGNLLQKNQILVPDNAASAKDPRSFSGVSVKENKQENQAGPFKEERFKHGTCCEVVSGCVPSLQLKQENQRVMGDSSSPENHLEGQGQNVLEREDERVKMRTTNEKVIHIKSRSDGLIEPGQKASKDCSAENHVEKPSLEGRSHMNLDSLANGCATRKLVNRDDDENFVRCAQPNSKIKISGSPGSPPDTIKVKDASHFVNDENNSGDNSVLENSERMYPFKKRKFFYQTSSSTSDSWSHCQGIVDSSSTRVNVIEESSSMADQQVHPASKGCNVKLSIKSFKVPELFIDIPETATIGSLKRTVMEAVTAILGDELHVGILLQGKKVRDDSKTLIQTGISQDDKRHRLGFMLEPRHNRMSSSYNDDPCFLTTGSRQKLSRQSNSLMLQQGSYNVSRERSTVKIENCAEGDLNGVSSLGDTSANNNNMSKCRALVTVPAINMDALAVVPYRRKSGNPDFGQRRIRRPFSVLEVEALVQAVEKLGTGRWRDVKQRAFDNAKHRTYVDLKDKWKTLVHTARISPQQRRGEPVPQELLDRVLAAHAYWSQQQCKHQLKSM
ncbi:telomere repeat-binding protein 5 isoform X3 [Lathyrus oleraceus]|uniref:telomere repeat-binding protein 5 isoform X3 n=1 Tax=Pisum sativum TaxID=3888 RepID=UPI0021CEBD1B|nr:telomere repeat-binding protein 5-like isoform X3 [Pisum sativum]